MFRVSQFMRVLNQPGSKIRTGKPKGPVVIWNLIRRCNLTCKHCYAISADTDFPGELSTEQVYDVMDDLKQYGVPVLILSGGEPLMRADIFKLSRHAKAMGFYTALSTNGTLIDENNIDEIASIGYDYLGISIDGLQKTHDKFRRRIGAFDEAMHGIRLCRDKGIKVGLRFTVTQDNVDEFTDLLELMDTEKIDKFYLSHLNYAGRGDKNRRDDTEIQMTREVMDHLFDVAWDAELKQTGQEFVTGNNDADGVYFLHWVRKRFPEKAEAIHQQLIAWGGNSSGVNISNIDNLGNVHPDTMWWNYNLGNVKQRPFSEIWEDTSDPLMAGLKQSPRPLKGRCRVCSYQNVCGGNTRTRAFQMTDDPWWQDPGCYLTDEELEIKYADYADDQPQGNQLQRRIVRRAS